MESGSVAAQRCSGSLWIAPRHGPILRRTGGLASRIDQHVTFDNPRGRPQLFKAFHLFPDCIFGRGLQVPDPTNDQLADLVLTAAPVICRVSTQVEEVPDDPV